MDKAEVVNGEREWIGVPERREVVDVESVHMLAYGCACESPEHSAKSTVLSNGADPQPRSGTERAVKRITCPRGE
jgi:hypothetical protein